jgi:hypothetical protein
MTLRQRLLGVVAAVALSAVATAKPPAEGGPLSDGRELDPVARDAYLPPPTGERATDRAPTRPAEKPGDTVSAFIVALAEALLRELTIPLGTAGPDRPR